MDAFFYPVCKKFCSFPELCKDIKAQQIKLNRDNILIWFGHGQIFRFGLMSVTMELQRLLSSIWARRKEAIVFISTLIPTPPRVSFTAPAIIKFNEQLVSNVTKWANARKRIRVIQAHQVFISQVQKLDERNGLFIETLEFHQDTHKDFNVNRLSPSGWFKLRKFWLKEMARLMGEMDWALPGIQQESSDDSSEDSLEAPHQCWRSPVTVLDEDVCDRDSN